MTARLPRLHNVEAFVEAARRLSFQGAAAALHITPSGVSRRIQRLEKELGVALFQRLNRALKLTPAGKAYLAAVGPALDQIGQASRRWRRPRAGGRASLRIATLQSFTALWLLPRLPRFHARHPGIEIEIETGVTLEDLERGGFDLGIRFGLGNWPGLAAEKLWPLAVFPVCAPALLKGPKAIRKPADLSRATLLHESHVMGLWPAWLAKAGVTPPPGQGRRFDNLELLYRAAEQGMGVALAVAPLVKSYIEDGRLVAPFAIKAAIPQSYFLVYRPEDKRLDPVAKFRAWLLAEAKRG